MIWIGLKYGMFKIYVGKYGIFFSFITTSKKEISFLLVSLVNSIFECK